MFIEIKKVRMPFFWGLIFSICVHVAGFFLFNVKIVSKRYLSNINKSDVTFIGGILPSFTTGQLTDIHVLDSVSKYRRIIKISDKIAPDIFKNKKISRLRDFHKATVDFADNNVIDAIEEFNFSFDNEKNLPISLSNVDNFFLEDNLKNRQLIYKPKISEIKDLILLYSNFGIVELRVTIVPNGKISKVDILKTTGNSVIDTALKSYFRRFIFEPIFVDKNQVSNIKFNLAKVAKYKSKIDD